MQKDDLIYRQAAIEAIACAIWHYPNLSFLSDYDHAHELAKDALKRLSSAEPERLTDDDFETIRIHLNAQKEKLCNQHRWKEAEEYQRIIDRFMAFASAQPEINRINLIHAITSGIIATNSNDVYSCGMRNGMRWCKSLLSDKEPKYEDASQYAEPKRTKDIIQKFHDYQIEWLTSHNDLELEPMLEEWIIRFLHDTANCYMMALELLHNGTGQGKEKQ